MARTRKPMPLWLPIVAAVCLGIAAVLQQDTFSRVLMAVAAVLFGLTALLQWRMQRRDR
ncbi:hypothetical protein [Agrococcus sp. Marseille-P2731]|uniref:hypothetical protein n=1 Tax=Agrococcus sp. Marseille-P2731 TaxID=1841862 RepID=UPI0013564C1D|nr:hypothetical protein [Agrococcus sp. Marseille-P2731]